MTLKTQQLTYSVRGKLLIENINVSFYPGTLYGILGPNGSGKSTLLKLLAGIWTATKGEVLWQGHHFLKWPRSQISRVISWVPQNLPLHFDFCVKDIVTMGRYPHDDRNSIHHNDQIVQQALSHVDAWHLADRPLSQLSGGERQRVYLARALATEASILLLDEPTSYLDLRHQLEVWQLLQRLTAEGKMIIVTLHDFAAARRFCDQLIILHEGHCIAQGTYQDVMTVPLLQTTFRVKPSLQPCFFDLD